jgi:dolichol-phosphate mannosyltransferase
MESNGHFFSIRYKHQPSIDFTLVIPVKNEQDNIAILSKEISDTLNQTSYLWECIWVDDGSTDLTPQELQEACKNDPHHRVITLKKSLGQSGALAVGFSEALGHVVSMMDGDGQNDPKDFPTLIKELSNLKGDMVNGFRNKRKDTIVRKISSRLANGVRNRLTKETIRDVGCSIRVIKRECLEGIPVFKGMHRFLPTLIRMNGFSKISEIPVNHRERQFNETKYGISNRLWVGIHDLLGIRWLRTRMVVSKE